MASSPPGFVVPNTRIPRTIGVLNITFSSLILIVGMCYLASFALMPMMNKWMAIATQKVEQDVKLSILYSDTRRRPTSS